MTNKPMLSVEQRELLGKAASLLEIHGDRPSLETCVADDLRALLDAQHVVCSNGILCQNSKCAECGGNGAYKPAAQHQGEPVAKAKPVAKLHAERLTGRDGEYAVTVEDSEWLNTCRLTGGIFNLYAEQPAPVVTVAKLTQAVHDVAGFPGVTGYQLRELADRLNGGKP